jgi:hypothetical protein
MLNKGFSPKTITKLQESEEKKPNLTEFPNQVASRIDTKTPGKIAALSLKDKKLVVVKRATGRPPNEEDLSN